jgi:hypothetical protein
LHSSLSVYHEPQILGRLREQRAFCPASELPAGESDGRLKAARPGRLEVDIAGTSFSLEPLSISSRLYVTVDATMTSATK